MTHGPDVWWWRLESADGSPTGASASGGAKEQEFPTRGDAESWIGETWSELADDDVAQVTLFQGERQVYGPMGLAAQ